MASAVTKVAIPSSSVFGIRCQISSAAGSPLRNEMPKSPWNAAWKYFRYCSHSGRSSPQAAR